MLLYSVKWYSFLGYDIRDGLGYIDARWHVSEAEIQRRIDLHLSKEMNNILEVDIAEMIVSDAFAYDKNKEPDAKYFIAYETNNKIIPLFIQVPQMNGY